MPQPFPNYAKSSHPAVLASVRTIHEQYTGFLEKARAVSTKYTGSAGNGYLSGSPLDRMVITGIAASSVEASTLPGRWKKPDGDKIVPYASNPAHEDFDLNYKAENIPGRGNLIWGHGRLGTGNVFEHEGAIYSHIGFTTHDLNERDAQAMNEFGWAEILGSEYHHAKEAIDKLATATKESQDAP